MKYFNKFWQDRKWMQDTGHLTQEIREAVAKSRGTRIFITKEKDKLPQEMLEKYRI